MRWTPCLKLPLSSTVVSWWISNWIINMTVWVCYSSSETRPVGGHSAERGRKVGTCVCIHTCLSLLELSDRVLACVPVRSTWKREGRVQCRQTDGSEKKWETGWPAQLKYQAFCMCMCESGRVCLCVCVSIPDWVSVVGAGHSYTAGRDEGERGAEESHRTEWPTPLQGPWARGAEQPA